MTDQRNSEFPDIRLRNHRFFVVQKYFLTNRLDLEVKWRRARCIAQRSHRESPPYNDL